MDAACAGNFLQPPCYKLCPIRRCTAEGKQSWIARSVHCICRTWGEEMRQSPLYWLALRYRGSADEPGGAQEACVDQGPLQEA